MTASASVHSPQQHAPQHPPQSRRQAQESLGLQTLSLDECSSICADGSSPPANYSANTLAISSTVSLSCTSDDLPTNAIASIFGQGTGNVDYQCHISQLWAYEHCGCPTPISDDINIRPCWICQDGSEAFDKNIWVPTSATQDGIEGSCGFQALYTGLRYDYFGRGSDNVESKCPAMTWGMDTWCGCPAETATVPTCTLCGGGTPSSHVKHNNACKYNPLSVKLHGNNGVVVGPTFGTCQYYDWMVERLNEGQCFVFGDMNTRTIQFNDFDVQAFCCNDVDALTVPSEFYPTPITLCGDDTTAVVVGDKIIPPLGISCAEVEALTPYLTNETVLVTAWDEDETEPSLREFCCRADTPWNTETVPPPSQQECQPIPRVEYEPPPPSSSATTTASYSSTLYHSFVIMIMIPMIMTTSSLLPLGCSSWLVL